MFSCRLRSGPMGFMRRFYLALVLFCVGAMAGNAALAQANTPPAGYTRCAGENQFCDFNGAASVVYGAKNTWTAPRTFTGNTVSCSNNTFGDPLPNMSKACYAKAVDAPPPPPPQPTVDTPPAGYSRCAGEKGTCSFTGTSNVVYGALGSWTAPRSFTNGTACNNNVFGDPAYGRAKSCYRQEAGVPKFELAVTLIGSGSVGFSDGSSCASSCTKSVNAGTNIALTASPSSGYTFTGWSSACSGTANCTVTLDAAKSVTANFVPVAAATQTLTVTLAGSGRVVFSDGSECSATCTKSFKAGVDVALTAQSTSGSVFGGWGGACSGGGACNVKMNTGRSVSATFNAVVSAGGKTYYVDSNVANDSGGGTAASPKKYLSSGAQLLSPNGGDTLIVKPGTYSDTKDVLNGQGPGKAGAWNVIKAEVDGTVTIKVAIDLAAKRDHYLQFEGLNWDSMAGKGVSGRYVKVLRCGFKGGPMTGNTMNLAIGTSDATPGAQHILIEDSYFHGVGGRYSVLVYNADSVVLRRLVVRHEAGWTDTKGDPEAGIALYNSTNVLTQNLLVVDSKGGRNFTSAIYHPSNSRASKNIRNTGAVVLNTAGTGVGWDDGATVSGMTLEDSAVVGSASIGVFVNGGQKNVALKNVTIVRGSEYGTATYGNYNTAANFSIADSIVAGNAKGQFNGGITVTNVSGAMPSWLTQPVGTTGATILKRLGKSGTLHGEAGHDQPQPENLWPFPNESAVKKAMCEGVPIPTGLCASTTLTRYVWEALGSPIPAGVYP